MRLRRVKPILSPLVQNSEMGVRPVLLPSLALGEGTPTAGRKNGGAWRTYPRVRNSLTSLTRCHMVHIDRDPAEGPLKALHQRQPHREPRQIHKRRVRLSQ